MKGGRDISECGGIKIEKREWVSYGILRRLRKGRQLTDTGRP